MTAGDRLPSAVDVELTSEIVDRPPRRPFLHAVAQTYGTQIGIAALSLGNALIVARALGPEGRGEVAFLTAIAWLVSSLSMLGVQEATVNLVGSEPHARRAIATNSVILSLVLGASGAGAVAALVAVVPAVGGPSEWPLLLVTLAFVPTLILDVCLRFLIQGDYGFTVTNVAVSVPPLLNVTVNGSLAIVGVITVETAVGTWLAGHVLSVLTLVWYVARRACGFGRPQLLIGRRMLGFGIRSHLGRVMLLANYRLDQWILGAISGARQLGLYSVAVAWAEALFLLPTALSSVQRPDLVRASAREASRQAARLFRMSLILTTFFAAGIVVAAPLLCVTFFGEDFHGSIAFLRILALGGFGIVALKQLSSALIARQRPMLSSVAIGAAFASTVLLDVVLIPPHGALGAAIASTVSYTLGGCVIAVIFVRALGTGTGELVPGRRDLSSCLNWCLTLVRHRFSSRTRSGV